MENMQLIERTAQLIAHRVVHAAEHDAGNGKLHGFCAVCGVPWPCAYAGKPPNIDRCGWLETVVRDVVLSCPKDCGGELVVDCDNVVVNLYCTCDKDFKYTTDLSSHARAQS